jgi:hypothetical protein
MRSGRLDFYPRTSSITRLIDLYFSTHSPSSQRYTRPTPKSRRGRKDEHQRCEAIEGDGVSHAKAGRGARVLSDDGLPGGGLFCLVAKVRQGRGDKDGDDQDGQCAPDDSDEQEGPSAQGRARCPFSRGGDFAQHGSVRIQTILGCVSGPRLSITQVRA